MDRTRKQDGRTDTRTDTRTDGRTDGRTVRLLYASQSSFGGIQITHISLSLSLSLSLLVDLSMHFDFPERMCMYQSLSLFLSLFTFAKTVWIQIRPDWNSGKNVSSICDGKYAKCRTKADAHDKMGCQYISMRVYIVRSMRGSRGVRTPSPPPPPLKNHKNKEFLSNAGPDPLKFSKLSSQHSTLGHNRHASETPIKGVSLAGH